MNWNSGFSASYYATVVDPATWRDIDTINLTGGSVTKSTAKLLESADIELTTLPVTGETWIRLWLDAKQGESGAHEALFTGLLSAPSVDWDGRRESHKVEAYSVIKPADDVLLQLGWYVAAGTNGAKAAADLLAVGPAPVSYADDAPTLTSAIVAEKKETCLTMAQKIIDAIGWRIRINGRGEISIEPKATEAAAIFDPLDNDVVELSLSDSQDWFACPNVFRATSGDLTAIARDENEASALSIPTRGREVWAQETNCKLSSEESLADYARRKLAELQSPARSVTYARRYMPDLVVGDVVALHYPGQRIEGSFRIVSQKIELGFGARTQEEGEQLHD